MVAEGPPALVVHRPLGMNARLVAEPPPAEPGMLWIVCPWLRGLAGPYGFWLSVLPVHDANAHLAEPPDMPPGPARDDVYWGVFALDLFRSRETIWKLARRRGIGGFVNLPSLSFFTGRTGAIFADLGFSVESEVPFLLEAQAQGFRVGFFGEPRTIDAFAFHDFDLMLTAEPPDGAA